VSAPVPVVVGPEPTVVLVVVVVDESFVLLSLPELVQLKNHKANPPKKSTRLIVKFLMEIMINTSLLSQLFCHKGRWHKPADLTSWLVLFVHRFAVVQALKRKMRGPRRLSTSFIISAIRSK
jgi:hypothetical protein